MTLLEAITLGLVQGLTEFLPVSSTAHLRLVPALLGWPDPGAALSAVIQCGTLVAVLIYFQRDVVQIARAMLRGLRRGEPLAEPEARLGWLIALGTVPIVLFGLLLKEHIESTFRSLYVIAAALVGLALVLAATELWLRRRAAAARSIGQLTVADALLVGLAQAVALVPGASRSGVTLTGCLWCGLDRYSAARFSFLLSLPAVLAAGVVELIDQRQTLLGSGTTANLVVAMAASAISGYAAIAFLLGYLKTHTTWVFIVYRLLLGAILLTLLATGRLTP